MLGEEERRFIYVEINEGLSYNLKTKTSEISECMNERRV